MSSLVDSTERDVTLDLLEMFDRAMDSGRLVGSDGTTLEAVTEGARSTITLTLSSGQTFEVRVRERARVSS